MCYFQFHGLMFHIRENAAICWQNDICHLDIYLLLINCFQLYAEQTCSLSVECNILRVVWYGNLIRLQNIIIKIELSHLLAQPSFLIIHLSDLKAVSGAFSLLVTCYFTWYIIIWQMDSMRLYVHIHTHIQKQQPNFFSFNCTYIQMEAWSWWCQCFFHWWWCWWWWGVCVCVCVCMCVCVCVGVHACVHVCVRVCMHAHVHVHL